MEIGFTNNSSFRRALPPERKKPINSPNNMISVGLDWKIELENANEAGILGTNHNFDSNQYITNLRRAVLLVRDGYTYENNRVDEEEERKKALAQQQTLFMAA